MMLLMQRTGRASGDSQVPLVHAGQWRVDTPDHYRQGMGILGLAPSQQDSSRDARGLTWRSASQACRHGSPYRYFDSLIAWNVGDFLIALRRCAGRDT